VSRGGEICVVGLGNIGSPLVPLLARMPQVDRLILVDGDVYEESNLRGQDILPGDLGRSKAKVQARRARRIDPGLEVRAHYALMERLPAGELSADLILACLDSRRARQNLHERAWRLGVPLIDAGVRPEQLLARVSVYMPAPEAPCMECGWGAEDYRLLEHVYPCDAAGNGTRSDFATPVEGQDQSSTAATKLVSPPMTAVSHERPAIPPTAAPSQLGALAAALQAIEARKFLEDPGSLEGGLEILLDARGHHLYASRYRRNPDCLFDHQVWPYEELPRRPARIRLDELLKSARSRLSGDPRAWSISVQGEPFIRELRCPACDGSRPFWKLLNSLREDHCTDCGVVLSYGAMDRFDSLPLRDLPAVLRRGPLSRLGIRPGDLLRIQSGDASVSFQLAR